MSSDGQYEIFWLDIKMPEALEEVDVAREEISDQAIIHNFTKDGWKLISVIPFTMKKNEKEIQLHRLYFQREGQVFASEITERFNNYLKEDKNENKKLDNNYTNISKKDTFKSSESFRSSITPLQNLNLQTPTFC